MFKKVLIFIVFLLLILSNISFYYYFNNKIKNINKVNDSSEKRYKYQIENLKKENEEFLSNSNKDNELNIYYTENGRTVYQLGNMYYYLDKNELRLYPNFFETFDKYLENFEVFKQDEYVLKCNNKNKDIYIGENLEYKDNYCKSETKDLFVQTFNVLSVVNNMDALYYYVTIRKFNFDEVYTARILKSLNPTMKSNQPYEFTFRYTDYKFQNNVHNPDDISLDSLFKNADLLKVVETNKYGLDQINDTIKR